MNIDLEDAAIVAYECASRLYKSTQENVWGQLSECRMNIGIEESNEISSQMMGFLLTDNNCSYAIRAAALRNAMTIFEGVMSRSKSLGNTSGNTEQNDFIKECQENSNAHAICSHAQTIAVHMQAMQDQTMKINKKLKM